MNLVVRMFKSVIYTIQSRLQAKLVMHILPFKRDPEGSKFLSCCWVMAGIIPWPLIIFKILVLNNLFFKLVEAHPSDWHVERLWNLLFLCMLDKGPLSYWILNTDQRLFDMGRQLLSCKSQILFVWVANPCDGLQLFLVGLSNIGKIT